jgi:hypothetical protein
MKKYFAVPSLLGSFLLVSLGHAADLKQSTFTQVVNDVRIVSAANSSEKPAMVNAVFNMPDLVRTGEASRAELVAEDKTITRVGANTIFSFDPANRTINLQQGSLLFHSPKGMGGGTIRTSSATAAVLGTTLIVTTTRSGGFKVIDLEGHVAIKFLSGVHQDLNPGQMTFVLAGGRPAPVLTIRLDTLTKDSHLVQGFAAPLPSMPLIQQQVDTQVKEIQSGQAQDTGLLVGDDATPNNVQAVKVDPQTIADTQQAQGGVSTGSVIINSSALNPAFISTFSSSGSTFTAFDAPLDTPNIIFNTSTVDLSPYAGSSSAFGFEAPNNITFNGSVTFNGLAANSTSFLDIFAGNQLSIAPGSTLQADVGSFFLSADGPSGINWSGVNLVDHDPMGFIIVDGLSSLSLTNGSINAQNFIDLLSSNDVSVTGTTLIATNGIFIDSLNGNVALNNPTLSTSSLGIFAAGSVKVTSDVSHNFQVTNVTVNAGGDIFVDGGDSNPMPNVPKAGSILLTAANLLTAQNVKFDSMTVNLSAHTVNLTNVAFSNGSTVKLSSHFGVLAPGANTNQPSVLGDVNFINNVTYNGTPAQGHIVASGVGITIAGGVP